MKIPDGSTNLYNPRGRIVFVRICDVPKLLAKGFMRVTPNQKHDYNPVFDRKDKDVVLQENLTEPPDVIKYDLTVEEV